MEDDQNGRRPKWKTTRIEDDQNARQQKWKTTKMEDNQNGIRPKWKTTKMKVKKNQFRVFLKDKGASYLRFARFFISNLDKKVLLILYINSIFPNNLNLIYFQITFP